MTKIEKDRLNKKMEELKANEERFIELYNQIEKLEKDLGVEIMFNSPTLGGWITVFDEDNNQIHLENINKDYKHFKNNDWTYVTREEMEKREAEKGGNQ